MFYPHPLNETYIFNTTNAPNYILHTRKMKDRKYESNILVANVTNLVKMYLQLHTNTYLYIILIYILIIKGSNSLN
jgi:hypothetical protein